MSRLSQLAFGIILAMPIGTAVGPTHLAASALAQPLRYAPATTDRSSNQCPQRGYSHPDCAVVPRSGCFQVHVISEPITLEGCEKKNDQDAGHHIITSPASNPCPTVPNGPQDAGSLVLRADGSFPPLRLKTPPPPGGKLYQVLPPGARGPGACKSITAVVGPGEYEVVYPGYRIASAAASQKKKSHR